MAPILAPEQYAFPLQAAGIAACFARGAIVPMLWDTTKPYLLIKFAVALISVVYIIVKHWPTQTPLFFPILWSIAVLISFISFEAFFFLVVRSSKELGLFGQFHVFLWTLLKSLRVGAVEVMKVIVRMLYGFANVGACREDQLLNSEEGVERTPVGGCSVGNLPIGDCPVEELEVSPPPPYVSTFPSIMFTAYQDPIMQYTVVSDDGLIQIRDIYKLV